MNVTTKIVFDIETWMILEHEHYEYSCPIALCCGGPSAGEEAVAGEQASLFNQLQNNYAAVFGDSSNIYQQLVKTFSPIVAAGPNQEGFNQTEWNTLQSSVAENTGIASANAQKLAAQQFAGQQVPSGARAALVARIGTSAAMSQATTMAALREQSFAQGRQNWLAATSGLAGAPSVFAPATSAGGAAVSAGQAAFASQKTMEEQQQAGSVWGAIGGVLGKVAPMALNAIAPGAGSAASAATSAFAGGGGGSSMAPDLGESSGEYASEATGPGGIPWGSD